jgi:hypothetical protein
VAHFTLSLICFRKKEKRTRCLTHIASSSNVEGWRVCRPDGKLVLPSCPFRDPSVSSICRCYHHTVNATLPSLNGLISSRALQARQLPTKHAYPPFLSCTLTWNPFVTTFHFSWITIWYRTERSNAWRSKPMYSKAIPLYNDVCGSRMNFTWWKWAIHGFKYHYESHVLWYRWCVAWFSG